MIPMLDTGLIAIYPGKDSCTRQSSQEWCFKLISIIHLFEI